MPDVTDVKAWSLEESLINSWLDALSAKYSTSALQILRIARLFAALSALNSNISHLSLFHPESIRGSLNRRDWVFLLCPAASRGFLTNDINRSWFHDRMLLRGIVEGVVFG